MEPSKSTLTFRSQQVLRALTFLLFLGRAWQHLRWDAPFRTLFWDQVWMEGLVNALLGWEWQVYATHPAVDAFIQVLTRILGVLYLLGAVAALMAGRKPERLWNVLLLLGACGLLFLTFLQWKAHFFQMANLMEHSIQWSLPIFLWASFKPWVSRKQMLGGLSVMTALTFIGHGLYAASIYPLPGNFVAMTIRILPLDEVGAAHFLALMGTLDFIAAAGIFWRGKARPFLVYCIIWGTLTALARVVAGFYWEFPLESLDLWTFETLVRLGHGGVPWILLIELSGSGSHT